MALSSDPTFYFDADPYPDPAPTPTPTVKHILLFYIVFSKTKLIDRNRNIKLVT